MPLFMQKGQELEAEDVEAIDCKDGKRRYRRKDNKTWVKLLTYWAGSATIRLAYKTKRTWKNRILEVRYEFYSLEQLSEEEAIEIAEMIVSEEQDWFDFYNEKHVIGLEQREVKIEADDMHFLRELEDERQILEKEKVYDLKGWV